MRLAAVIIILALNVFGLGIAFAKNGESKGTFVFWIELLSFCIMMLLYAFAGLFDVFL